MNYHPNPREGFTLVEIMVVVVIIGLLAALAAPAWQKVRESSVRSVMDGDARQLAHAAQQYFMDKGVTTVPVGYAAGVISGPLAENVHFVAPQYTAISPVLTTTGDFTMSHPALAVPRVYDPEGHFQP